MSFLSKYLEHTKIYESPTSFWKWSAYAIISSIIRDNCYHCQGEDRLYPNIYVLLLADSGVHRKGKPVRFAENFITAVNNTKIISGRASIQAILDELAHTETDNKTGQILKGGSAIFLAQELSGSLVSDEQSIGILTDIYEYRRKYTSILRTQGKFKIDSLVFSMFAASNEDLLRGVYDTTAIKGGLLARTFVILPSEFRESNSLLDIPDTTSGERELIAKLKQIALLRGNFIIDPNAIKEYESWYKPFRMSYKNKVDKSGVVGRIHTGVLKLALILAANDYELQVKKQHIEEAITECLALIPNYRSFIMISGKSNISETGATIIEDLLAAKDHCISRKLLLREHWSLFDSELLDKATITLEQAGLITSILDGNEQAFRLTDKCLELMGGSK